jgi:hypothetical protein
MLVLISILILSVVFSYYILKNSFGEPTGFINNDYRVRNDYKVLNNIEESEQWFF